MGTFDSNPDVNKNQENINSPNVQTVLNLSNLCLFFYTKTTALL